MIPVDYIREWKNKVTWPLNNLVEHDLIICRALVKIFNHPLLADSLAFRGGTALFKLHYLLARKAFPFSVRWYRWVGLRGEFDCVLSIKPAARAGSGAQYFILHRCLDKPFKRNTMHP